MNQGIACLPFGFFDENGWTRIVLDELFLRVVQTPGFAFHDGKAMCEPDSGFYEFAERELAVFVRSDQARNGARYAGCFMAVQAQAGDHIAGVIEVHIPMGRSGCLLPVIERNILAFREVGNEESTAAEVARTGINHRQGQLGSDGSVDRITALFQDLQSCIADQGMGRYHGSASRRHLFNGRVVVWIQLCLEQDDL